MAPDSVIIEVQDLVKTFPAPNGKGRVGVGVTEGLSFTIRRGEIFGLIGPDGAGKTTLFRLLTSLFEPEKGKVFLDGLDTKDQYREVRQHIGYMPGQFSLYQDLTVKENLEFFATIYDSKIEDNYELIADIYDQIAPFKNRKAMALSGGMKQKLALCCALIHKPKVLFLDEPTTGIDPVSRVELWDMLGRLSEHQVTVVVSTAYMDEANRCNRVALMQAGQIISLDTPQKITAAYPYDLFSVSGDPMIQMLKDLRKLSNAESCFAFGDTHHLAVRKGVARSEEIERYLYEKGYKNVTVKNIEPTLEDSFMSLSSEEDEI